MIREPPTPSHEVSLRRLAQYCWLRNGWLGMIADGYMQLMTVTVTEHNK